MPDGQADTGRTSFWRRLGDVAEALGKSEEERQGEAMQLLWERVADLERRLSRIEKPPASPSARTA